jgi:hypothetical protein
MKARGLPPHEQRPFLAAKLEALKQQFSPYLCYDRSDHGYKGSIKRCDQFIQSLSNSHIIANEDRKDLLIINLKQWEQTVKGRHTDDLLDKFYIVSKCAQLFNYDPFIARY